MARKVNKKFVIVLSAAVFSACTGYAVLRLINHMRNQDPAVLTARAEAAEKAGDLKTAAVNFAAAAAATSKKHKPGADNIYVHAAELCMQVSESAKTDEDAVQFYQSALAFYDAAQQENPRNKAAADTKLELEYQKALYGHTWSDLEKQATKQIATLDGPKPRAYRAQARLSLLLISQSAVKPGSFEGIKEDIKKALEFDPNYGMAVALNAQEIWQESLFTVIIPARIMSNKVYREVVARLEGGADTQSASRPSTSPSTASARSEADAAEEYYRAVVKARSILMDYLAKHGMNSDVASSLANLNREQHMRLHVTVLDDHQKEMESRQKELGPTVEILEKALAADPSNFQLLRTLDAYYRYLGMADKSDLAYKRYVQIKPEGPEAYFLLASFYRSRMELPKAIETYKESLRHQQASSGLDAIRNRQFQMEAIDAIAGINLDLAEPLVSISTATTRRKTEDESRADADKVQVFVKEAMDYTDKLRSSHAPQGWIYLLDGRRELVNRHIKQAMELLRNAAANLSGLDNNRVRLAKLYLADANQLITPPQIGAAVSLIREALDLRVPEASDMDMQLQVRLGALLNKSAKYDEAAAAMQAVLGEPIQPFEGKFQNESQIQDPQLRNSAKQIWAMAMSNMPGEVKNGEARKVFELLGALPEDRGSTLQLALTELASDEPGNMAAAASDAMKVIDRKDGVPQDDLIMAYQVAVTAYLNMAERDKAKEVAAQGLEKFPTSAQIKYLKEQANSPDGTVPRDVQRQILESIPDEYQKQSQLAYFYQSGKDADKEIAALQAAEKSVEGSAATDAKEKLISAIDRAFVSSANAARKTAQEAKAETDVAKAAALTAKANGYWKIADDYVAKAVKQNLDGMDGKLYLGRLELFKTDYQSGLARVEQAVAQRQDYAFGHLILAQAYYGQQDWNAALTEFRNVIRLSPNSIPALQGAVEILLHHKADSASLKEARDYLNVGLHLAPYNPLFAEFGDELDDNLDAAIATRERNRLRFPNDTNNILRLTVLYARKMEKEPDLNAKLTAINKAIDLAQKEVDKTPQHLGRMDLLARLFISRSKQEIRDQKDADARFADIVTGLKLYVPFVNDQDTTKRLDALVFRGDFIQKLPALSKEWADALVKAGLLRQPSLINEAALTYGDAIALEGPKDDRAERHLGDMYFDLGSSDALLPAGRKEAIQLAESVYAKAVEKNKDSDIRDAVLRRLIETQLRLGKHEEASKQLDDFLARHPKDVQALVLKGYASIQEQKLQPALESLNAALKLSENDPQALYYRADAMYKLADDVKAALRDLQAARPRDPSVNSRLRMAQIYRGMQMYGEAAVYYQEVEDMRPDLYSVRVEYADFLYRLAVLQTKLPSSSNENFVRAIRELNPAEKLFVQLKDAQARFPGNLRWWLMYADLLKVRGSVREARAYYEALYKVQPEESQIIDAYLLSLIDNKDYQKAVDLVTQLLANNAAFIARNPPYVVFYLRRAAALQALNKAPEAIADLDRAITFAVDYANNSVDEKGKKTTDLGPFVIVLNEASAIFKPAEIIAARLRARLAANPNELVTQIGLLQILVQLGQSEEALKVANSIQLPTVEENRILRGQALREMALARYRGKSFTTAYNDFQEVLKIFPDDVDTLNNLAYMLANDMEPKRTKEAIDTANRALQILQTRSEDDAIKVTASSANVLDTLGWAQYQAGQNDDAIKSLSKALNTQPLPAAYLHLAMAYVKKNDLGIADTTVQEGINMAKLLDDETLPELKKLKDRIDEIRGR